MTTQQTSTISRRLELQRRIGARFARALRGEFRRQAGRVHDRYLASVGAAPNLRSSKPPHLPRTSRPLQTTKARESFLTEADLRALILLFNISEQQMYEASAALADGLLGTPNIDIATGQVVPRQLPLPVRERIAARVGQVNEVTRRAIAQTIRQGMADNLSHQDIAKRLRSTVRETYKNRAETIARTETALVDQEAAHDRYRAAGVTEVRILDSPDCGLTSHNDSDKPNGSIRPIEEAERYPVSHPNCVRSSAPIVP